MRRRLGRLRGEGSARHSGLASGSPVASPRMHHVHWPRTQSRLLAEARNLLGGNGILLENYVIRHIADIEAIYTFEGTETIQTLLVGRDITGLSVQLSHRHARWTGFAHTKEERRMEFPASRCRACPTGQHRHLGGGRCVDPCLRHRCGGKVSPGSAWTRTTLPLEARFLPTGSPRDLTLTFTVAQGNRQRRF
jgi:hypothetical protein